MSIVRRRASAAARASGRSDDPALEIVELEAEARHARERYHLYRAKAYGPRATSVGRLRELERRSALLDGRLDRARARRGRVAPRR